MPRGDRTGPAGLGSRTGRGLGYCAGYESPGFAKSPGGGGVWGYDRRGAYYPGRGMAWGRGSRGWWGRGGYFKGGRAGIFYAGPTYSTIQITEEQRLEVLKEDKEYIEAEIKGLQGALENIAKKIKDLETSE